jgi:hypothetical protein
VRVGSGQASGPRRRRRGHGGGLLDVRGKRGARSTAAARRPADRRRFRADTGSPSHRGRAPSAGCPRRRKGRNAGRALSTAATGVCAGDHIDDSAPGPAGLLDDASRDPGGLVAPGHLAAQGSAGLGRLPAEPAAGAGSRAASTVTTCHGTGVAAHASGVAARLASGVATGTSGLATHRASGVATRASAFVAALATGRAAPRSPREARADAGRRTFGTSQAFGAGRRAFDKAEDFGNAW